MVAVPPPAMATVVVASSLMALLRTRARLAQGILSLVVASVATRTAATVAVLATAAVEAAVEAAIRAVVAETVVAAAAASFVLMQTMSRRKPLMRSTAGAQYRGSMASALLFQVPNFHQML